MPPLEVLHTVFVYCMVWAFGCGLAMSDDGTDYAKEFSEWWRGQWKKIKFPSRENVFDYWLDPKTWKFEAWVKSPYFYVVDYNSLETPMGQVTVPTSETCAVDYWMANMVENRRGVMLAGPAGTGKTQMVMGMLNSQDPAVRVSCIINFNFYTDSTVLQTTMEVPLEKKTGMNFGPPARPSSSTSSMTSTSPRWTRTTRSQPLPCSVSTWSTDTSMTSASSSRSTSPTPWLSRA